MNEVFDLREFSKTNLRRCIEGFGHSLESWSEAEWTNAMAGEAGEACNLAKKIIRFRDNVAGNRGEAIEELWQKMGRELADVVIYADLCAQRIGMDLSTLVRETFNNKSAELGCPIRFEDEDYLAAQFCIHNGHLHPAGQCFFSREERIAWAREHHGGTQ